MPASSSFLQACRAVIGTAYVLTDATDTAAYLTDQRKRYTGRALAVLKPGSSEEIAAIVKLCHQQRIPIVPQGGNTGLVLGSVPD
ncbi:MAG: FAD-binding protein, partial [Herbaspirillum sp.]